MTPQDFQLDWLKCFVAVVDTGSLSWLPVSAQIASPCVAHDK